jgi:hypothetical protein
MKSSLVALLWLIVAVTSATSQSPSPAGQFPAHRQFNHNHSILSTTTGDLTVWYIDPIFVRNSLSFSAAFAYKQGIPATPKLVQLSFAAGRGVGYDFESNRDLELVLDDVDQVKLGMMEFDAGNNMVRLFVPLDTFLRIVNASTVSGQIGNAAFQLDEGAMEAMRDLASRMAPR